jgi:hypothetical protein
MMSSRPLHTTNVCFSVQPSPPMSVPRTHTGDFARTVTVTDNAHEPASTQPRSSGGVNVRLAALLVTLSQQGPTGHEVEPGPCHRPPAAAHSPALSWFVVMYVPVSGSYRSTVASDHEPSSPCTQHPPRHATRQSYPGISNGPSCPCGCRRSIGQSACSVIVHDPSSLQHQTGQASIVQQRSCVNVPERLSHTYSYVSSQPPIVLPPQHRPTHPRHVPAGA